MSVNMNVDPSSIVSPSLEKNTNDECDIIDLDSYKTSEDHVYEWHTKVRLQLKNHNLDGSEGAIDSLMKWYIQSLNEEAVNLEDLKNLKILVLKHICFFKLYSFELQGRFIDNYFDNMEEILAIYLNLELKSIPKKQKDSNKRIYRKCLLSVCRKTISVLNLYLMNREDRIYHALMKMKLTSLSEESKDLLNLLYGKLLVKEPKDKSDMAFCRSYILYQMWKTIRNPEDWEKMDELVYKLYDRTRDSVTNNTNLRQILLPQMNSIHNMVREKHIIIIGEYFKYMNSIKIQEENVILPELSEIDVNDDFLLDSNEDDEHLEFYKAYVSYKMSMASLSKEKSDGKLDGSRIININEEDDDDDCQIVTISSTPDNLEESHLIQEILDDDLEIINFKAGERQSTTKKEKKKDKRSLSFLNSIDELGTPQVSTEKVCSSTNAPVAIHQISSSTNPMEQDTAVCEELSQKLMEHNSPCSISSTDIISTELMNDPISSETKIQNPPCESLKSIDTETQTDNFTETSDNTNTSNCEDNKMMTNSKLSNIPSDEYVLNTDNPMLAQVSTNMAPTCIKQETDINKEISESGNLILSSEEISKKNSIKQTEGSSGAEHPIKSLQSVEEQSPDYNDKHNLQSPQDSNADNQMELELEIESDDQTSMTKKHYLSNSSEMENSKCSSLCDHNSEKDADIQINMDSTNQEEEENGQDLNETSVKHNFNSVSEVHYTEEISKKLPNESPVDAVENACKSPSTYNTLPTYLNEEALNHEAHQVMVTCVTEEPARSLPDLSSVYVHSSCFKASDINNLSNLPLNFNNSVSLQSSSSNNCHDSGTALPSTPCTSTDFVTTPSSNVPLSVQSSSLNLPSNDQDHLEVHNDPNMDFKYHLKPATIKKHDVDSSLELKNPSGSQEVNPQRLGMDSVNQKVGEEGQVQKNISLNNSVDILNGNCFIEEIPQSLPTLVPVYTDQDPSKSTAIYNLSNIPPTFNEITSVQSSTNKFVDTLSISLGIPYTSDFIATHSSNEIPLNMQNTLIHLPLSDQYNLCSNKDNNVSFQMNLEPNITTVPIDKYNINCSLEQEDGSRVAMVSDSNTNVNLITLNREQEVKSHDLIETSVNQDSNIVGCFTEQNLGNSPVLSQVDADTTTSKPLETDNPSTNPLILNDISSVQDSLHNKYVDTTSISPSILGTSTNFTVVPGSDHNVALTVQNTPVKLPSPDSTNIQVVDKNVFSWGDSEHCQVEYENLNGVFQGEMYLSNDRYCFEDYITYAKRNDVSENPVDNENVSQNDPQAVEEVEEIEVTDSILIHDKDLPFIVKEVVPTNANINIITDNEYDKSFINSDIYNCAKGLVSGQLEVPEHIDENVALQNTTVDEEANVEKVNADGNEQDVDNATASQRKIMYTSSEKVQNHVVELSIYDKFKETYNVDEAFSGPVSKMNGSSSCISPDKNFDLFSSKPSGIHQERTLQIPFNSNELNYPTYEGIGDFRNYKENQHNINILPPARVTSLNQMTNDQLLLEKTYVKNSNKNAAPIFSPNGRILESGKVSSRKPSVVPQEHSNNMLGISPLRVAPLDIDYASNVNMLQSCDISSRKTANSSDLVAPDCKRSKRSSKGKRHHRSKRMKTTNDVVKSTNTVPHFPMGNPHTSLYDTDVLQNRKRNAKSLSTNIDVSPNVLCNNEKVPLYDKGSATFVNSEDNLKLESAMSMSTKNNTPRFSKDYNVDKHEKLANSYDKSKQSKVDKPDRPGTTNSEVSTKVDVNFVGKEAGLPLKKRKFSVAKAVDKINKYETKRTNVEVNDINKEEILKQLENEIDDINEEELLKQAKAEENYPAETMRSIAEFLLPRPFKTAAEKKEMPPTCTQNYTTDLGSLNILPQQYNKHTYNNTAINY